MTAEEAVAQDDAANAIADRFDRWARLVLAALAVLVLVGTPAAIVTARVLVHQSSTLDRQANALADDRKASQQRDTVVAQQRELLDRQHAFEKLLADLLAARTEAEANAIRAQIGAQFGSNASPPTSSTTTRPPSSSTTTTTTAPRSAPPPPPSSSPSTTTTTTSAPPAGPPATIPAPVPLPPAIGPVCAVLPICPSASGRRPLATFGP